MIKIDNLNLSINGENILKNINLDIEKSKITALLGPNGAGKSSLLKCVTGSLKFSEDNKIKIEGRNLNSYSANEIARKRSVLSQNLEVNFPFTVKDIVMMGRSPHIKNIEKKHDHEIVEQSLEKVNMLDFRDRQFSGLSGGEKQRVQLARVLAQLQDKEGKDKGEASSKYLFLDEPTSAQDLKQQNDIMRLVKNLVSEGWLTVFAIMHDINLISAFADDVILMKEGRVIFQGEKSKTLTTKNLEEVFNTEINSHKLTKSKRTIFYI